MREAIRDNGEAAPSVGQGRGPEGQVAPRSIRSASGRGSSRALCRRLLALALFLLPLAAYAQFAQQGPKLVGTGALGPAEQGCSVALSADGNTALVGGCTDNAGGSLFGDGASWVWTRSAGVWTQQAKLADPAAVGTIADQGFSVALSADGNTALVGAPTNIGSTRVWTRSGAIWTLEATLVGTGTTGSVEFQGVSVALSADGNTAIVGGSVDDGGSATTYGVGAAWIFTRSGGIWTQQGSKLVGSDAIGASDQGVSVALSADGNTALVGGDLDNGGVGALWVWTRSGGVWSQQGPKLTGLPVAGTGGFGSSVAVSSDGNTAVVGAHDSSGGIGALYPFTRSGGVWTQQSFPVFGGDFSGSFPPQQGISIALSGDGNTAVLGGDGDGNGAGAAWVFTRAGSAWSQQGTKMVGTGAVGPAQQGWRVAISADGLTALVGGVYDNSKNGAAWVFVATAPAVTQQPASIGACAGSPVTFSATGASWPAASVQWQVSTDGGATFNDIPGETSTLLTFTATVPLSGNQYRAVFTNSLGTTTSAAGTLTVGTVPVITTNPLSQTVAAGSPVTFTAAATGSPAPTVQWFVSFDGGATFSAVPGATSTTLTFTATTNLNGALYGAQFTTTCQAVSTSLALLTVTAPPPPPAPPVVTTQPTSVAVCPGQGGALAQFLQQGARLQGTGASGAAQGISVALSADGNTALVGGHLDNSDTGAVWVFTRSGDTWTQQGPKLVASATGSYQGAAVALSADGNTALIGGLGLAAWVWTRSGGVWTQQGPPLTGAGMGPNNPVFGRAVALSADGNTAAVGGGWGGGWIGAVWIFTRSGGIWSPQGPLLQGSGAVGLDAQGSSVALSADGNTLLEGGFEDNSGTGATWVFTRSGGAWTQQGGKLVGTGASAAANQGIRVALSSDGNTAAWGAFNDASPGAMWVFTRGGGVWTQQGPKLVGTGAVGNAHQGDSLALSGDGNTALCSGFADAGNIGAVWVFTRSLGVWTQQGAKLVGTGSQFPSSFAPQQGTSVALSTDGSTAIVGGIDDFPGGAAWVFAKNQESFTAAANGSPTPTVQWQVSTDGGTTFQDIAGATSNGLTVTASPSSNGNQYRAVFTNTDGVSTFTATSDAATFTVNSAPVVTTDPAVQIRNPGQTATFTAAASGSPAPGVQWQVSAQGFGPFGDIAGATSPTLSFTVTQAMIGNRYRAVFTDGCGTATSASAVLGAQVALTTVASPSADGSVSPASGGLYDPGTVVPIQATPNPGFVFTGWTGPVASPSSASTTVTFNESTTVTANFAAAPSIESIPTLGPGGLALLAGLLALGGLWVLGSRKGIGS